jgi:opacity protein-like surface antigen
MKKRLHVTLVLSLVLGLGAVAATGGRAGAQEAGTQYIGLAPRIGVQLKDPQEFVIGAEGRFGILQIAPSVRFDVRGQFNYYFESDVTIWDLAADAIFAFDVKNDMVEPYAFAGLDIGHASVSTAFGSASSTEVGLNLGGGAKFLPRQRIQPYAELRFTIGNFDPILLSGGVLFLIK